MPKQTIITCDLCGDSAELYPVPFALHNRNLLKVVDVEGVFKESPPDYEVLPPQHPDGYICLCIAHYGGLLQAIQEWLKQNIPTIDDLRDDLELAM